jgi:predicted dehydrogenase
MRTAIIGLGGETGAALLPALQRTEGRLEPAALCDEDHALLEKAGKVFPKAALFRDMETIFSRCGKLEAAVVRGPAWKRYRAALRALQNKMHTVCETPFCFSVTDLEKLREEAQAAGLTLSCLQPWERSAAWLALEKAVTSGLFGRVTRAEARLLLPGPVPEGGITAAAGWKAFAMLLATARLAPQALAARLTPRPAAGADPLDGAASFQVHFNGADGGVYLAAGAHSHSAVLYVSGEKGRAELDGDLLRLDVAGLKPETVRLRDSVAEPARAEWLAAELEDFAKEVKGELPAGTGLRNARYCARLIKNAYYSASVNSSAVPL